jgi:hypothetical protein
MKTSDTIARPDCAFCTGTLPTIHLRTTQCGINSNVDVRICRACILTALNAIEHPTEYPAVIEDRDADLATIEEGKDAA